MLRHCPPWAQASYIFLFAHKTARKGGKKGTEVERVRKQDAGSQALGVSEGKTSVRRELQLHRAARAIILLLNELSPRAPADHHPPPHPPAHGSESILNTRHSLSSYITLPSMAVLPGESQNPTVS